MKWKTLFFNNKTDCNNFILKNHNKKGFRYESHFDGDSYSVTYKFYKPED